MTLKELIQKFSWDQISSRYFEIFPPYNDEIPPVFEPVWKELDRLMPLSRQSDKTIFIDLCEYGYDVYGKNGSINENTGNMEMFALELTPWEEWFEMAVSEKTLKEYPEIDIVCICVNEMTVLGLDQKTIEEEKLELERRIADIESGNAKWIPWEEVKSRILERLEQSKANLDFESGSGCGDPTTDFSVKDP